MRCKTCREIYNGVCIRGFNPDEWKASIESRADICHPNSSHLSPKQMEIE